MIMMGKAWMRYLQSWAQGHRHPNTAGTIYKNVCQWDQLRKILRGRCTICDFVVSNDEKYVKELFFKCDDQFCACNKADREGGTHLVCDLCEAMFRALYSNHGLKNMNYFKAIDVN